MADIASSAPRLLQRGATVTLLLALTFGLASGDPERRFYPDDPLSVEPETQDASQAVPQKIDLFYDFMLNQFATPGLPAGPRAGNVNTIDEVPDSSWFTNRILAREVSPAEAARGPVSGPGPAPGRWWVTHAKTEGAAPGFTIRDSAGVIWFLAFDPKSNPEGATGAAVVASKIFWTLGYNQAEYFIAELHRDELSIDPEATYRPPSGRERKMKFKDIKPVFDRVARKSDGSYRVMASKLLPGKILGGFKYYGTRPDDPNDIVPHEHRRELRALKAFGGWTNLVDIKALNTMDTLIAENGRSRVRHYLLDVGSTFGIAANGPHEWWEGYEYLFDRDPLLKRMASVGFYISPWQTVNYEIYPAIGRFEGDQFEPDAWKTRVPASALLRVRDDDLFWAARRVMAFSNKMIREIVKAGQYTDPAAADYLADVLIKRRDKIGRAYLTRLNPLVDFSLTPSGGLSFANPAVQFGFAAAPSSYTAVWSDFDNSTGVALRLAETKGDSTSLPAPDGLPSGAGSYIRVEVSADGAPELAWSIPVSVYFRRTGDGWELVGLERMPDNIAPPEVVKTSSR